MHWVSAARSVEAEVRLYNPLFTRPDPGADGDFSTDINPLSVEVLHHSRLEPALADARSGEAIQFERQGYFCLDAPHSGNRPVFNRTLGLRDSK
jgi:glutaminyl-tRNA synthetase